MNQNPQKAFYKNGPVATLAKLAEVLGISVQELHRLIRRANQSYRSVRTVKTDGTPRATWNASKALKQVHG